MGLTSFEFICFFAATAVIYYILKGRFQWGVLLCAGVIFYYFAGGKAAVPFLIYTSAVTYVGAICIDRSAQGSRARTFCTAAAVILTLTPLFLLKYIRFFGFEAPFGSLSPLGISFYTLTALGYVIDVSWDVASPQRNFLKHTLFVSYFPQMVSGPITRYGEMGPKLYSAHSFSYERTCAGVQRMLWGFFKKLVIAERMAVIVDAVYGQYELYPGRCLAAATICFSFQLYMDFAGCMDIVLGASQVLGIELPENFAQPFLSRSISEYWRRWHITLGEWFRTYLFYPIQKSGIMQKLATWSKRRFGKKRGKKLPLYLSMLILWFLVGMWHGGSWNYIVGSGLLHWLYIVSGETLTPLWKNMISFFRVRTEGRAWHLFQILRTFLLVNLGFVFFRAPSLKSGLRICKRILLAWGSSVPDGGLFAQILAPRDWIVALIGLLLVAVVSLLQTRGVRVREAVAAQSLPVKWTLYLGLLAAVLIFGRYGSGYDSAAFIYQNF